MNQPVGGGRPHGGAPQYVDNPVQHGVAPNPYAGPNPYAPPQHRGYAVQPGRGGPNGEWVACPRCHSPYVNKATFTWWGGVVGPLIIPEVKCATCGNSFNGKTGGSLAAAIAVYLAVVLGFVFSIAAVGMYFVITSS